MELITYIGFDADVCFVDLGHGFGVSKNQLLSGRAHQRTPPNVIRIRNFRDTAEPYTTFRLLGQTIQVSWDESVNDLLLKWHC